MSYEQEFLSALLFTLAIEIPAVIILIKYFYQNQNIRLAKIIFASLIASTLTLPYFWFVAPAFTFDRNVYVYGGESVIILIEAIIYYQLLELKFSRAIIVSLVANILSAYLGTILV